MKCCAARHRPLLALAVTLALASFTACAPSTEEGEAEGRTEPTGPLSYVPTETGAAWAYLPNGAPLSDPRMTVTVEGPTVLDGNVVTAWHQVGRGFDVTYYRRHDEEGTFLVREERPGTILTFDPPIRELPSGPLRVGETWSGETTATLRFPEAEATNRRQELDIQWVTTVVDRRTVDVVAGEFEVFVLNFTSRTTDEDGDVVDELTQETWFSPYLGEVRTENGFVLVESNLQGLPRAQ